MRGLAIIETISFSSSLQMNKERDKGLRQKPSFVSSISPLVKYTHLNIGMLFFLFLIVLIYFIPETLNKFQYGQALVISC